jgi:tripartite-type tricarboxylate transporter receptor subunit TctC
MKLRVRLTILLTALIGVSFALVGCKSGKTSVADYPKHTIKIIVPTSPGGGYDLGARIIAKYLPKYLPKKADVIVENMPGAGQMIGVHATYAAAPDGYTLGAFNTVAALMSQFIRTEDVKYDMNKFIYVGMWQRDTRGFGVSNVFVPKTWDEVVKRSHASAILTATGGAGTSQHIDALMVAAVSDLNMKYIHYDGSAQAEPALGRHEAEMEVAQVATLQNLAEQKLGKPFFVIADKRALQAPDVPTAIELGMPKDVYDKLMNTPFFGVDRAVVLPPGTDPAIVEILRKTVWQVLQDPAYQADVKKIQGENNPMAGLDYQAVVSKKIQSAKENPALVAKLKAAFY